MAELTIRLEVDPATGKKNVILEYASDADALPMEHEDEHRQLVDRLIEGGIVKAGELGRVVVERASEQDAPQLEADEQELSARASREQGA